MIRPEAEEAFVALYFGHAGLRYYRFFRERGFGRELLESWIEEWDDLPSRVARWLLEERYGAKRSE